MEEDVIKTSIKDNDRILIDVYKTVASGDYKGNCKMHGDTLILNYWEEIDEKLKKDHVWHWLFRFSFNMR